MPPGQRHGPPRCPRSCCGQGLLHLAIPRRNVTQVTYLRWPEPYIRLSHAACRSTRLGVLRMATFGVEGIRYFSHLRATGLVANGGPEDLTYVFNICNGFDSV